MNSVHTLTLSRIISNCIGYSGISEYFHISTKCSNYFGHLLFSVLDITSSIYRFSLLLKSCKENECLLLLSLRILTSWTNDSKFNRLNSIKTFMIYTYKSKFVKFKCSQYIYAYDTCSCFNYHLLISNTQSQHYYKIFIEFPSHLSLKI